MSNLLADPRVVDMPSKASRREMEDCQAALGMLIGAAVTRVLREYPKARGDGAEGRAERVDVDIVATVGVTQADPDPTLNVVVRGGLLRDVIASNASEVVLRSAVEEREAVVFGFDHNGHRVKVNDRVALVHARGNLPEGSVCRVVELSIDGSQKDGAYRPTGARVQSERSAEVFAVRMDEVYLVDAKRKAVQS